MRSGSSFLALFLLGAATANGAPPLTFSHLAGSVGGAGVDDGVGTSASFTYPGGVGVDTWGNVWVADSGNRKVRRIAPGGNVTTVAGSGASSSVDGSGTTASFTYPAAVAADATGAVYVADAGGNRIRRIAAGGAVTTLAGSGAYGSADGVGAAASFLWPAGVAVDGAGNVYVADAGNHKIRKVTPAGLVTTLAGSGVAGSADGTGAAASFREPSGVAVDASGNVYVADSGNNRVRKVTPTGLVTTLAGSGAAGSADGVATAATFEAPKGVAVDATGAVYVADWASQKIRKVAAGNVTTLAGSGRTGKGDGSGTVAAFYLPTGVAVDGSGNVYVADSRNHVVRKVTAAGTVSTLAGSAGNGSEDGTGAAASFFEPSGVGADALGNVYVADTLNHRIRRVTSSGGVTTMAGSAAGNADGAGSAASFRLPAGVAADPAGNVYVADAGNNRIRKVSAAGSVSTLAGSGSRGSADGSGASASFDTPYGVAVDALGTVYVADWGNARIRKVTASGEVSTLAGSGERGSVDGPGASATFWGPCAVALDAQGNLYVSDSGAHKIRKVTAAGLVSTLAGSGTRGKADGTGAAASFDTPCGVALDGATLWVADANNHLIRKVTTGGAVTTAGGTGSAGHADGSGTAASFFLPGGIAADGSGNVYVADTGNSSIRAGRVPASPCTPDASALCLLGGRFRVTAEWGDYGGGRGQGRAVALTSDTGYFWFFSSSNVEVVVKFVSFCGGGSNVAIYAGGLTDLDVKLHVTDTRDGTTRDYRSVLGTPFALVRDGPYVCPAAFADGGDDPARERSEEPGGDSRETLVAPSPGAVCAANQSTLCLLGGRFQVRAAYSDYASVPGIGKAYPLTSDTGTFWFFSATNIEVVVKMVSFCGGGSDNVAVYAGGLTDLDVTLTVTDVQTGLTRSYRNPLGTPFTLIKDGPFACR